MSEITRVEKLPTSFNRPADRFTFNLYGPHHIRRKSEKLIATIKMNVGDLSLNECDALPQLFAKAPAMQKHIDALKAENLRLREVLIDALEIIEDQMPGEFSDWEGRAYKALGGGA